MPRKKSAKIVLDSADKPSLGLLGEGSFGCVFRPPVQCSDAEKPLVRSRAARRPPTAAQRAVGKVFYDIKDFQKEVSASQATANIDPDGKRMLIPSASCQTTTEAVQEHPAGYLCEKHSDFLQSMGDRYQNKKLYQLLMPYGGIRLDDYVKSFRDATPMTAAAFVRLMMPILEGVVLLSANGQCHQDIKSSNVLVKGGRAILIDYSLMRPVDDIYASVNRRRWRYSYFPYPPEYKIFHRVVRDLRTSARAVADDAVALSTLIGAPKTRDEVFAEVRRNWVSFGERRGKAYYDLFGGDTKLRSAVDRLYDWAIQEATTRTKLTDVFAPFAEKVDVYSVGMIFTELSHLLVPLPTKQAAALRAFIRSLAHPDPRERLGPTAALAAGKKLLKVLSG